MPVTAEDKVVEDKVNKHKNDTEKSINSSLYLSKPCSSVYRLKSQADDEDEKIMISDPNRTSWLVDVT